MAMVVVDASCLIQADSQPKSRGLVWGSAAAWRCSTFTRWSEWTLAMTWSWWQHYKYRPGYYYYYYYGYRQFSAENYIMFVCVVPFGAGNCTVDHACHTVRLIKVFQWVRESRWLSFSVNIWLGIRLMAFWYFHSEASSADSDTLCLMSVTCTNKVEWLSVCLCVCLLPYC